MESVNGAMDKYIRGGKYLRQKENRIHIHTHNCAHKADTCRNTPAVRGSLELGNTPGVYTTHPYTYTYTKAPASQEDQATTPAVPSHDHKTKRADPSHPIARFLSLILVFFHSPTRFLSSYRFLIILCADL